MKKCLKIFGITAGSIIGLVVLVAGIVLWLVFTPERLTPIVRNVAKDYVVCEHEIGKVELTFFSTFPKFGLEIDSVVLKQDMEGEASDTLIFAPRLVATVDVAELLDNKLHIYELRIPEVRANVFVDESGVGNFAVFNLPSDTTITTDTTTFALPFEEIRVDAMHVGAKRVTIENKASAMDIAVEGISLDATLRSINDIHLRLTVENSYACVDSIVYAHNMRLAADIPAWVDLDEMAIQLREAQVAVEEYAVHLDGWLRWKEDIEVDMKVALEDWQIAEVLALLPASWLSGMDGIEIDGIVSAEVAASGVYNEDSIPVVDAHVILREGRGNYAALPYTFTPVSLDAELHLDMQHKELTSIKVHELKAHTGGSYVHAEGEINDLLGDIWMDVDTRLSIGLVDVKHFLPEDIMAAGVVSGRLGLHMHLDDLLAMDWEKGKIVGDLQLTDIQYATDSIYARLPDNRLTVHIPNTAPSREELGWLSGRLSIADGDVEMTDMLHAEMTGMSMAVELSNILNGDAHLHAKLSLERAEQLHVVMDSMDITAMGADIELAGTYNMTDTLEMPKAKGKVGFERLYGHYTDIHLDMGKTELTAGLQAPRLTASIQTDYLWANMGQEIGVSTQEVKVAAAAMYDKDGGDNLLLKWRPRLSVDLNQAEVTIADWEEKLMIPEMDFNYSNRGLHINESKLVLGKSDFELTGEVRNIGNWLREKGVLTGELNFVSQHTDAEELLALLSADQGTEEQSEEVKNKEEMKDSEAMIKDEEIEPFLVPTNVDLTLNTEIKQANFYNQTARNLSGKIYVKDGILVLEEMGFICNAAKLQLTAMYRTPRRNHIYVGFDYHMIDINIHELIHMIPQIDSIMPMLRQFKGEAEFHLAAETYTNAQYKLKPSTLRGAASIFGKDLVVLDNETFDKISKLLLFSKKTENKVDSISAEMTLYKKEIDVYPFCVSMDNYMVALGGRHNLDMTFDYNVNVLSPIYLGVNVSGQLGDLKIKLAPCKYAKDFKPLFHRKVDTQSAELRSMIRESMRKNVKL